MLLEPHRWPDGALESLQAKAVQERLAFAEEAKAPSKPHWLVAVERFSLHAGTWVHRNDRKGLERLCRYGSRGAVAMERRSALEDGKYEYRTKRGQVLVMTAAELVRRLLVLVPPRGAHLTNFHGVFAPNVRLCPYVVDSPAQPRPAIESEFAASRTLRREAKGSKAEMLPQPTPPAPEPRFRRAKPMEGDRGSRPTSTPARNTGSSCRSAFRPCPAGRWECRAARSGGQAPDARRRSP
jgi:hypothetical protein